MIGKNSKLTTLENASWYRLYQQISNIYSLYVLLYVQWFLSFLSSMTWKEMELTAVAQSISGLVNFSVLSDYVFQICTYISESHYLRERFLTTSWILLKNSINFPTEAQIKLDNDKTHLFIYFKDVITCWYNIVCM